NPGHERCAAAAVRQAFPGLAISTSHEVAPVIREDERFSTTVANAYVKPLAATYLDRLVDGLVGRSIRAPMLLMLSDGGLAAREDVVRVPVHAIESGPAAGVIAATAFGLETGRRELLAFDMGGTTAKLCLVSDGQPNRSRLFEAARTRRFMKGSGLPISTPTVELIEIGAGGGSIASADAMGLLKVGPESAGSSPGPACFGLGGTRPTVTDANFLLGYLDPKSFAGGTLAIRTELAREAIGRLAAELGLSLERTAWGIVDVVNETMARAASVHIAEHGRDPREFVLTATGGGGPLHAWQVARKLGVSRILCPAGAGVASAIGLLRAPASVTAVRSSLQAFDQIDWEALERLFRALEDEARTLLARTGIDMSHAIVRRQIDLRYAGQSSETSVPLRATPCAPLESREQALKAFDRVYRSRYARAPRSTALELTGIQVEVGVEAPEWPQGASYDARPKAEGATASVRPAYFPEVERYMPTPVHHRMHLTPGQTYEGPAIVEDRTSTIVVGPGARFTVDAATHLTIILTEVGEHVS
ncbi:MAG: hydantoinase/oxoprolinase family protein, partial [Hyphomicrobiaceae bacterium]